MSDATKVQALIDEGHECLEACDYERAIIIGHKLEKHRHSYAFELLALAYAAKEELSKAITVLERGVSLAPADWLLWQLLGNYYSDTKRWADARQAYARALECPTVDQSSVFYNCALVSLREEKPADAMEELDHVTSAELKLKAASLRINSYTSMGKVSEAVRYAEEMLGEISINDVDQDNDEADDVARLYGAYAEAVWMKGDSERALALAWQAISCWRQENSALWLIREIENMHSNQARYHRLMIEGVWSEPFDDDVLPCGFFTTYGVVADDPDEAFNLAKRFEPTDVRESLHLLECEVTSESNDIPKGVYFISRYSFFPGEEAHID